MPQLPDRQRPRPFDEQLRRSVNANLIRIAEDGLKSIEHMKKAAVKHLSQNGITELDELAEGAADLVKRALMKGLSK